jgi:hypothetical protein
MISMTICRNGAQTTVEGNAPAMRLLTGEIRRDVKSSLRNLPQYFSDKGLRWINARFRADRQPEITRNQFNECLDQFDRLARIAA